MIRPGETDPLDELHPAVAQAARDALAWAEYYDIPVTVTSGNRTCAEQAELRRKYELGLSRWPANRPGDSAHQYGLAFDSTTPDGPGGQWDSTWITIRRWIGFNVPQNDIIHAELPAWRDFLLWRRCGFHGA